MQWFAGRVLDMGLEEGKPGQAEDRPATRKSCVDTTVYHSRRNLRLVTETKWGDPGNVKRTRLEPLNYRTNLSAHMVAPGPPPADAVILTPGVLQSILPRTYRRSTSARKAPAEPLPGPGTTQADEELLAGMSVVVGVLPGTSAVHDWQIKEKGHLSP